MINIENSSIAAIATAQGVGGIAVIRISGKNSAEIVDKIFKGKKKVSDLSAYSATFGKIVDSDLRVIDEVVVLNFVAPQSYTGENVVEISCHGGNYTAKRILNLVIDSGARAATEGEFTKRAFLNGKIDLAQAESVIELIHATGKRAHEAALSVKEGRLSKEINSLLGNLVDMGGDLSAWADYPDDDMPIIDNEKLSTKLTEVCGKLESLIENFDMGKVYRDGLNTVIAGRPNVGKSTIMNLLSGCERSIVTDIAGTTRDVVEERVMLGEIPLILADTAGIRATQDPVEKIGVRLAKDRISSAELVFAVFDVSAQLSDEDKELIELCKTRPCVAIINKTDLEVKADTNFIEKNIENCLYVSALSGEGSTQLREIVEKMFSTGKIVSGTSQLCTQRQREAVYRAKIAVDEAISTLELNLTLDAVTVVIEEAVSALLELKGERVSDVLVDNVFSRFCVGK